MNFLAHALLSFEDPNILAGNLLSDFVKGKKQFEFPPEVQVGIRLHRAIDQFTDAHPVIYQMKTFFKPAYRLYSGAFVDVLCDHFLAMMNLSLQLKNIYSISHKKLTRSLTNYRIYFLNLSKLFFRI